MWLSQELFMLRPKMDVKYVFLTKPAIKLRWSIVGSEADEVD